MALAPVRHLFPHRLYQDQQQSTGTYDPHISKGSLRVIHLFVDVVKCFVPRIKT